MYEYVYIYTYIYIDRYACIYIYIVRAHTSFNIQINKYMYIYRGAELGAGRISLYVWTCAS